jgi:hypothetical protein
LLTAMSQSDYDLGLMDRAQTATVLRRLVNAD